MAEGAAGIVSALWLMLLLPLAHDVHVSTTRLAIEGSTVAMRVTLYRNDLQTALRAALKQPAYELAASARGDSIALAYLDTHLELRAGPDRLACALLGSGEEAGQRRELDQWYYDLRCEAAAPIRSLAIRNEILFDLFRDQRNIVKAKLPTGAVRTVFFVPDENRYDLHW